MRLSDILAERAADGPSVRNLGTGFRGNVATTGGRYQKSIEREAEKGIDTTDTKRLAKEVQAAVIRGADALDNSPII